MADIPIDQIIFILIFLVFGFLRWLGDHLQKRANKQEKKQARREPPRRRTIQPPSPAQTRKPRPDHSFRPEKAESPQRRQRPQTIEDLFRDLGVPIPAAEPEMPSQPEPPKVEVVPERRPESRDSAETRGPESPVAPRVSLKVEKRRSGKRRNELTRMLKSQDSFKTAFILREVIDQPRSLRDFPH